MGHDHNHSHGTENVSDGVLLWTVIVNLGLSVFEFAAGKDGVEDGIRTRDPRNHKPML